MQHLKANTFQYISALTEPRILQKLLYKASKFANIVIDLEDSIMDPDCENKTRLLKKKARNNLRQLFVNKPNIEVGIRINSTETDKDIALLEELCNIQWKYIVLPKIESFDQIMGYMASLKPIHFHEIIICIESTKGLKNLASILKNNNSKQLSKVQFGHFDYFLDAGVFPIPSQSEPLFWQVCKNIISLVESHAYTYLHSPTSSLNSQSYMNSIVGKLKEICTNQFGLATVTLNQSMQLHNFKDNKDESLRIATNSIEDKTVYAEKISAIYSKSRKNNLSFHYKNGVFISPQEYFAAKKYLLRNA